MNLIYAPPSGSFEYPYSIWQLRKHNPNVSFSGNPTAVDIAPFHAYFVTPAPQPEVDQRTQRVEEVNPVRREDGTWIQAWDVRPATAEEINAFDVAHRPLPDWMGFGIALASSPAIAILFDSISSPISNGLSIGLSEASKGDPVLFVGLWSRLLATGMITPELLGAMTALAQQFNLPAEFIAALAPPESQVM